MEEHRRCLQVRASVLDLDTRTRQQRIDAHPDASPPLVYGRALKLQVLVSTDVGSSKVLRSTHGVRIEGVS